MVTATINEQKNIVFIGASCAAIGASLDWCQNHDENYRMILIEAKSHFNHVFCFPRAAVVGGFEEELFVPYDNLFDGDDTIGKVIQARATAIHEDYVELDREVPGFGNKVEYAYLVYSAGTRIPEPGRFKEESKEECIARLKQHQKLIAEAESPIVIGAGAVGLELASEIKEFYPEKNVTLVHSRNRYLPKFKVSVDVMTYNILKKKGIKQVLGDRVRLPPGGYPQEVGPVEVHTLGGKVIHGDLAIMCIGMTPNNALLAELAPDCINKKTGLVRIKPTMQIEDDRFPNIFAAGDVCEHTDCKNGHSAWMQAIAALTNIRKMIEGAPLEPYRSRNTANIRLVLGKKDAIIQTDMLGPSIAVGSWIAGRNIPYNVHAAMSWFWLKNDLRAVAAKSIKPY
ncbi:hypothetical protein BDF20DRAFT_838639 [Mycotypha africana]|uniref:uncharacterized protein n=1 Tax=Mycotypha africana TaxID=64632 RepID=UPI00230192E5|nr:uncharacterized protein BDF20DRAFT_838639 [Mycotypha africana]KAI8970268.1 hypothetical protein BDF20DRAFT_838639 [Mycotypha africana]